MKSKILNLIRKLFFKKSSYKYSIFGINKFSYVYTQPNGLSHYFGTYETEIQDLIISKSNNSNLIFNIGAAYGYYASYFSKKCNNIILFEPDSESTKKLNELAKLIKFNFKIINKFVSNFNNENTISLNNAFEKFGIPDFIKVDIEGGEKTLMNNSYEIIKKKFIKMIIELHSEEIEISIIKDLNQHDINFKIINAHDKTRLIRKVTYMKWLIIN